MVILVTGAAGFIGFHLSARLLKQGHAVVGFDNVNPYYDPALKRARIAQLEATAERTSGTFQLIEADLEDRAAVEAAFAQHKPPASRASDPVVARKRHSVSGIGGIGERSALRGEKPPHA